VAAASVALLLAGCTDTSRGAAEPSDTSGSPAASPDDVGTAASWVSPDDYTPDRFADSADVEHRWYPLRPGMRLDYRGSSVEGGERLFHGVTIIVTDLTKRIDGVDNVVVWERDYTDEELVETELALFAQDEEGHIWHMGEYPEEWEDGEFDKAPAWVHGKAGATAGITIPAVPELGTPEFAQGFAPKPINWDDHGKVHLTDQRVCVPEDCYSDVVVIEEFEPSIPQAWQDKYYAPGIGVAKVGWRGKNDESKEVLELVDFRTLTDEELAEVRADALALEERAYRISKDVWAKTPPAQGPTG
jgi:hypothetical protein